MATAVATDLIADVLTARRDELLAAADEASVTRIRDADPALVEDARRHTAQDHDLLCDVLRRGHPLNRWSSTSWNGMPRCARSAGSRSPTS